MTAEEFDKTRFGNKDRVIYKTHVYWIIGVDFEERLINILWDNPDDTIWVRCENIDLLTTPTGEKEETK